VKTLKNTLTGLLLIVLWPLAIMALYEILKEKRRTRKKQQKLSALLDGQALEDVLLAAPYGYGHFQGENGYRVWDKRIENGFIGFARSRLDAELLIVERYLSEAY
jgi:hypothetical protein